MGIKDSLRNSLKKGLVGLLVGASAIGSFSGLVGCEERYERERQSYSRESQEKLDEDLLVITYDEWKNNDRLKEHAQYILKHPDEAYERLDEEGKKLYTEVKTDMEKKGGYTISKRDELQKLNNELNLFQQKYGINLPFISSDISLTYPNSYTKGQMIVLVYNIAHEISKGLQDFLKVD